MFTAALTQDLPRTASQLMMQRETHIAYGPVPHSICREPLKEAHWQLRHDQFLLRAEGESYFHYRRGHGITIDRGADADPSEEKLWLNGSVYAAIASLNGLQPIHASAVVFDGSVHAFAGPAGSGKSTLVAALAVHGLPMFCDDTLVLDLSDPDQIICLPGHKRLKLTPEAIDLARATPQERVSATVDKYYARPASEEAGVALPLAELIFLEEGDEPSIGWLSGGERFMRLQDDHYTTQLYAAARNFDRRRMFAHLARLARQIEIARFVRPWSKAQFHAAVATAARHITNGFDESRPK